MRPVGLCTFPAYGQESEIIIKRRFPRADSTLGMQKIVYGLGLISLPIIYVSLQKKNDELVDPVVLAMMALILAPLLLWNVISRVEKRFDAMSSGEQLEAVKDTAKTAVHKGRGGD